MNKGQTFAEVVIILFLVAMVITVLVSTGIFSMRLTAHNANRSQAIAYLQEGVELVRKRRDEGWTSFVEISRPSPRLWCINKQGVWFEVSDECPGNIDNIFARSVQLSYDSQNQRVIALIIVSWRDGGELRTSKTTTVLTKWR